MLTRVFQLCPSDWGKTRDWIVALKALILAHRLMNDGTPIFQKVIMYATRRGTRLLNMSDFRDEAHSSSWGHYAFVRTYAFYLDQRLELMLFDRKAGSVGVGGGDERFGGRENNFRVFLFKGRRRMMRVFLSIPIPFC